MKDYQLEIIKEKEELDKRIDSLQRNILIEFFDDLSYDEQKDMLSQLYHMRQYSDRLGYRIARFQSLRLG